MINVKDIKIRDYDYNLPENKIPLHPLEKRDECKLLLSTPEGRIYHRKFKELPGLMPPGTILVCNETKVINARLSFHKQTGAGIELFLLEPLYPSDYALNFQSTGSCVWKCLVGNSKKWKEGEIFIEKGSKKILQARRLKSLPDGYSEVEFFWDAGVLTFGTLIEELGRIPIPPYLNRDSEAKDLEDYQTVYARVKGSVAAPTAGLHFTTEVFENLAAHAIKVERVILHVGAGTFKPVKSENIGDHPMHSEPFTVSRNLIKTLLARQSGEGRVAAVGTTTVRTLESLPYIGRNLLEGKEKPFEVSQWDAYRNDEFSTDESLRAIEDYLEKNKMDFFNANTSIMIAPGFKWRVTDVMVTNFHQPKSTLLLLVSSFLGNRDWRKLYEEALGNDYRFLSYGDACLLMR